MSKVGKLVWQLFMTMLLQTVDLPVLILFLQLPSRHQFIIITSE